MMTLPVSEIFYSIDGEGIRTGLPTTFIRLFGCNLRCSYCDSMYAVEGGSDIKRMTVDEILEEVDDYLPCRCITLTGGEPLLNKEVLSLIRRLLAHQYQVNIETNGSIDLQYWRDELGDACPQNDYFFTMDWKSISSGVSDKMLASNLQILGEGDVLKFVVGSREDLEQMRAIVKDTFSLRCHIFVSPIWGQIDLADIIDYLKYSELVNVRVQCQLHKIAWDPAERGV